MALGLVAGPMEAARGARSCPVIILISFQNFLESLVRSFRARLSAWRLESLLRQCLRACLKAALVCSMVWNMTPDLGQPLRAHHRKALRACEWVSWQNSFHPGMVAYLFCICVSCINTLLAVPKAQITLLYIASIAAIWVWSLHSESLHIKRLWFSLMVVNDCSVNSLYWAKSSLFSFCQYIFPLLSRVSSLLEFIIVFSRSKATCSGRWSDEI